jgi:hypothetical protein
MDLTPATARQFLTELTLLSKRMGVGLAGAMELMKVDQAGRYTWSEAKLADGSVIFDRVIWTEPMS